MRVKYRVSVCLLFTQLAACSPSPLPLVDTQEALRDKPVLHAVSRPVLAVVPIPAPVSEQPQFVSETPRQQGRPAWYKRSKFTHTTATGEALDDSLFTAAHLTLPLGSYLRVVDTATETSVIVRVNDRGPYSRVYVIDLSKSAADALGMFRNPKMIVRLEPLSGVPATPVPVSTLPTGAAALAALSGGKPKAAVKKPTASKPVAGKPAPAKPKVAPAAKPPAKKPPLPKP